MDLQQWLDQVPAWAAKPNRKTLFYESKLIDVFGGIEISFSKKTGFVSASYQIGNKDFDKIAYGKICGAGILIIQCGFVKNNRSIISNIDNPYELKRLTDNIFQEYSIFTSEISSVSKSFDELISSHPRFPHADPRSASLRQLHAAILAFMLGEDWSVHILKARAAGGPLPVKWIDEVVKRISLRLR